MKDLLNKVMNMDCFEGLKQIPDESVDLIICDPPYGLSGKNKITCTSGRISICNKGEWDIFESLDELEDFTKSWLKEAKRILKNDGSLWCFGTYHLYPIVGYLMMKEGWMILNDVIWFKENAAPNITGRRFCASSEMIFWASKTKKYKFNSALSKNINKGKQMRNVWKTPSEIKIESDYIHPTQKPLSLYKRIIALTSNEEDIVVDFFAGSGTTAQACIELNRGFICFEKDEGYCNLAQKRISTYNANFLNNMLSVAVKKPQIAFDEYSPKGVK